jgi:hypothetical protein
MKNLLEIDLPKDDDDRSEWDDVWSTRPLRQLVNPVQIAVAPTADHAWGKVIRVEIAADPHQFAGLGWRETEICPVCGVTTSTGLRVAATIYPYFASGFSYGLGVWVHEPCFAACEEIAGPAPVPW